jgi:hypothetical protein
MPAKAGIPTIVRGREAFLTTRGDHPTMTWWENGHLVRVTGTAVSPADLGAFAEGLAAEQ